MTKDREILPGIQPVMLHHTDSVLIASASIYAAILGNHYEQFRVDPDYADRVQMMDDALRQAHELLDRQYAIEAVEPEGEA